MRTLSPSVARQQLLSRLSEGRAETDRLFAILNPDALYDRPIPERHRVCFYIGHLETFDWNLFKESLQLKSFNPQFDHLFAAGIDPVDGGLPSDTPANWPSISEIQDYRKRTQATLDSVFEETPDLDENLLNIAVEHRLMHAETLEYMFHQLPLDRKLHPGTEEPVSSQLVTPETLEIPAGAATLGMDREAKVFGWDNEFQQIVVKVPAFAVDRYKVTNGDFLEFVSSGGYTEPSLWTPSDWKWRTEAGISHPVFWVPSQQSWNYRAMFQNMPLPLAAPVLVSHAEASAYAKWRGKALPSEAEWHRAAYGTPEGGERQYPWGSQAAINSRTLWNPPPTGSSPEARSAFGVDDLIGTAWEWTSTEFAPFPGFEPMPSYPGYSANFFDGKHYVIKGGSTRTAASMLRRSFRNWFQPHYQYVYAGFRCVSR